MFSLAIDTNVLFNQEQGIELGHSSQQVFKTMCRLLESNKLTVFLPFRVKEEFVMLAKPEDLSYVNKFLSLCVIKNPSISSLQVNIQILYQLLYEYDTRLKKGMKILTQEIIKSIESSPHIFSNKTELQKYAQSFITPARARFRESTRHGILDNAADLDLILLSKEMQCPLVTCDAGIQLWSDLFGVQKMTPSSFGVIARDLLTKITGFS